MDIGLAVPQVGHFADPAVARTVAVAAEQAGFASVWVMDRLLAPVAPRTPWPGTPDGSVPAVHRAALDPFVTLTLAAAVTTRIRLGTGVVVAPWYPPLLLARTVASLDRVSRGRLTLGLGVGWSRDEYDAVGVPQAHLALRIEEILEVLAVAWRDEVVEIETSRETVAPSAVGVKPYQAPRPPVLLDGSTPADLERVARRGDGWFTADLPLSSVVPMWTGVRERAARYGRDVEALRLVHRADPVVTSEPVGGRRPAFTGSLGQVRGDIERARDLGVHELVLDLQSGTGSAPEMLELSASLTDGLAVPSATH